MSDAAAAPVIPNIIAALDDEILFAPFFRGDTWRAWRVFLAALFALPMSDADLTIYRECTCRTEPPSAPFKEAALVVGRRGGKSRTLAPVATFLATFRDYAPYLAPGEVATVAVIAADRKQARSIFRFTIGLLREVKLLAPMVQDDTAGTITLNNRVQIEIHTASFRVTRGYTFAAVLADETAFWRDDESRNPDTEIFRALRPGLSSIPGAILLNASSPYRKAGVLYRTFARHYGRDGARVLVWQADTATMNPGLDPAVIEEAYEDDPAAAAAEYGAQFRDDIADFISREAVQACVEIGCYERPPNRSVVRSYVCFLDAAGGAGSDSMTMSIAHSEHDVAVLDVLRERRPPFSPDGVVDEFAATMKEYGIATAESDRWGGDWVGEAFRKRGIRVTPSAKPKSDIYRELLPLISSRRCTLLDLPRLISQLCGLERRTARGGRDSIDHGPGAHDDCANAGAGALVLVQSRQPLIVSDDVLRALGGYVPHSQSTAALAGGGMTIKDDVLAALARPSPARAF
jgi:hypothetical protein